MITYWKPEFEALLLEVATHKLSLHYVDKLQSFYKKFEGKDDFDQIKFECEVLISTIYSYHQLKQKSFEIDLRLITENPPNYPGYWAVISRIASTSEYLHLVDDVMHYVIIFLKTPQDSFDKIRFPLLWYVKMRPEGENGSFDNFEHNLIPFESRAGLKLDRSIPFADRIILVQNELDRADHNYDAFYFAFKDASKEDRVKLVENYLATEHLEHYRERMKRFS